MIHSYLDELWNFGPWNIEPDYSLCNEFVKPVYDLNDFEEDISPTEVKESIKVEENTEPTFTEEMKGDEIQFLQESFDFEELKDEIENTEEKSNNQEIQESLPNEEEKSKEIPVSESNSSNSPSK